MAQSATTNPFASKVLIFTVGPKKAPFNIHEALLQAKTKFFDIHTQPNGGTCEVPSKELELERTFKSESSPSTDNDASEPAIVGIATPGLTATSDSTAANQNDAMIIKADYHLDTHFVKAFAIFVDWLYNVPPTQPKNPSQCKTLIQAYLLALQYQAFGLQNLLLDCIRCYHIEHQVNFDFFFIYLLNRHGDDVDCKLITYFVDQIAYEIADSNVEEFDKSNLGLDYFLRERSQGKVRAAFFHALAKIATAGKKGEKIVDPAVALKHDYYV
ncbi:hypothetical protein GJ744_002234 [Endocarpon pusillum]|uniref:BTB domain-containing protein n=1 Tax=Endocarpon pusillum TaxID=364733 RepID=A0A8H7E0K1_9EURO|nr:hypothetical protein GJ744_002234 [Endocarpon pusillum]